MEKKNTSSYLMLIGSMLIFGTIGIFRRYIPLSSALLAFSRGLLGSCFLLLFTLLTKKKIWQNIGGKKLLLLILTGAMIGFNWIFLFEAYNYTTVATATLCYYMQPVIVIFLSPFLFRERLTVKKGACAAFAILGMVLVSGVLEGSSDESGNLTGILFGLAAAALYAAIVIVCKLNSGIDAYQKTVVQLAAAALVMIPYLLLTEDFSAVQFTPVSMILTVFVGIVHTGIAYALYFAGMNGLKAQSVAVLSYIDPISALILSALILREKMSPLGVVGACLVIGATLLGEVDFPHKRKEKQL